MSEPRAARLVVSQDGETLESDLVPALSLGDILLQDHSEPPFVPM